MTLIVRLVCVSVGLRHALFLFDGGSVPHHSLGRSQDWTVWAKASHWLPDLRGLYQIQSLLGSSPCIGFLLMIAVKSHCRPWPSTKRTGPTSLSGSALIVLASNIFPGFEAWCHDVMLLPCQG